ncbi:MULTISPECIES: hypothetical protein [Vitreoscilla]|uniref:Lipoprotein n=1 Tax=Vitreoscilla stercoraria TaxID=61 RepID=A0ABY4EAD0_VITST|nr:MULTISPECIES: hypothetical protein [Vitreoscilla]AUZ03880.1 hypothetical protein ADP71_00180 [Vitreoscilla sp. C1]UOO92194.1 hypothetical protein LVJ81_11315 [Vitreoscilla stercoraria]
MLKLSFLVCCAVLSISACGHQTKDTESADLTQVIQNQTSHSNNYDQEIDTTLKHMQAQLPYQAGNFMEISSLKRTGKDIHYNFTILSEAITPQILSLDSNKQAAIQQLCAEKDTKKFLAAGYKMHFNYIFRNQETITLTVNQSSCHA